LTADAKSTHEHAAVDVDGLPRDVGRARGGEKQEQIDLIVDGGFVCW